MPISEKRTKAFWVCSVITGVSAIVSASFSVAALFSGSGNDTSALYAASRSISLPFVAVGCMWLRSRAGIAALAFTMGLVQLFDAVIGARSHDASKTYGPLVLAVATFASVGSMLRSPDNR
jgi:hypothetical protein